MMDMKNLLMSAALQMKMGLDNILPGIEILTNDKPEFKPVLDGYKNINHELILIIKALKEMPE